MLKPTLLVAFVVMAVTAFAQPDCSGTWTLNKDKSTLNAEFSMAPQKITVDQKGNDLKLNKEVDFQGNVMNIETGYTLDGKDCVNEGFQGTKITSNVKVAEDKASYKIVTKFPMQDGGDMEIIEQYQLADADLKVKTKATSSWGVIEETWVFEKQ